MAAVGASDFNALYLAHYRPVSDVAHRIVGSRAVADEIAQEVLLKAWLSSDAYDPTRGSVATYLRVMARHRAIDWVRSNSARARREIELAPKQRDTVVDSQAAALAGIEQRLVWDALAKLPAERRQPIVLAFFGGMSYREVAVYLRLPEGTVKSRIRSGMQALSMHLQPHE
ncbi:MAG: RNA polymerase sigma factor [Acidimicrobiales bacterium]